MQITFDTTNAQDLKILSVLMDLATSQSQMREHVQPEVTNNTGTTATGVSSLSPEGSGVSGPVAEQAPAAPVKRTRKPKEEAAAPVEKPEEPTGSSTKSEDADVSEPAPAKPLSLDEVRAALQQFTAKNGVPAGIDLLKTYGAGRISELNADQYADFVERCAA